MHTNVDRRAPGVRRVSLERIVDVCDSAAVASAFQGRAVDVSGRGMQLHSSHLPELGAKLVLRFQEPSGEVIAEGDVAWRKQGPDGGGEFGVRFTALDSKSVRALKSLCLGSKAVAEPSADPAPDTADDAGSLRGVPGAQRKGEAQGEEEQEHDTERMPDVAPAVNLHLAGRAPLRARVRSRSPEGLELGSQLEFLRIGRALEVEDLARGERRGGRIDALEVSVDRASHVPELIVAVRYDTAASAPAPHGELAGKAKVALEANVAREPARARALGASFAPSSSRVPRSAERSREERNAPEPRDGELRDSALRHAGPPDTELHDDEPRNNEQGDDEPRNIALRDDEPRNTEPRDDEPSAGDASFAARARRLSAVAGDDDDDGDVTARDPYEHEEDAAADDDSEPAGLEPLRARLTETWVTAGEALKWAGAGCARLGQHASQGAGWVWARARRARKGTPRGNVPSRRTASQLRPTRQAPLQRHARPLRPQIRGNATAPRVRRGTRILMLGAAFMGALAAGAWFGRSAQPESAAAAVSAPPPPLPPHAVPAAVDSPAPPAPATPEPAAPSDEGDPGEAVASLPLFGPSSLGARAKPPPDAEERPLARVKVPDERFDTPKSTKSAPEKPKTEFASGRLHLPIVYRLRLDRPGESLRGERTASGFDVVIAGRRVMESGADIARRDSRIAKVSTRREGGGTRVSFKFRGTVPAYKVRLRKDFVEFFISSP